MDSTLLTTIGARLTKGDNDKNFIQCFVLLLWIPQVIYEYGLSTGTGELKDFLHNQWNSTGFCYRKKSCSMFPSELLQRSRYRWMPKAVLGGPTSWDDPVLRGVPFSNFIASIWAFPPFTRSLLEATPDIESPKPLPSKPKSKSGEFHISLVNLFKNEEM